MSLAPLDDRIATALERVHAVVDKATGRAHAERRAMLETARRSLGQRLRWVRWHILGPDVVPVVFRFCRKEMEDGTRAETSIA